MAMGVLTSPLTPDMGTPKPKERQFQVVPVPGTFRRGRWECWDFRDVNPTEEHGIIEYGDKIVNGDVPNTVPLAAVSPTHDGDVSATLPSVQSVGTLLGADADGQTPRESGSTIVVTSVAPVAIPTAPRDPTGAQAAATQQQAAAQTTLSTATETVSAVPSVVPAVPPPDGNFTSVQSVEAVTPTQPLPPQESMSTPVKTAKDADQPDNTASPSTSATANSGTPTVAIDNKIEQAMDLVKTHLTFAVREEVDTLRSTIAELEAKVTFLENQNQVLRQFAPADIIANLPRLVQTTQPPAPTLPSQQLPSLTIPASIAPAIASVAESVKNSLISAQIATTLAEQQVPQEPTPTPIGIANPPTA